MEIAISIIIINILVWLLPPIKQYRRIYFYYFLILAGSDPLSIIFLKFFGIKTFQSFLVLSFLLIISILDSSTRKRYAYTFLIIGILIAFSSLYLFNEHSARIMLTLLHTILFSIFAKELVVNSAKTQTINLFYFFLTFYEATLSIKFFVSILRVETGIIYFYLTSAFQMLFGLYFAIANEEKPLLKINLNTSKLES